MARKRKKTADPSKIPGILRASELAQPAAASKVQTYAPTSAKGSHRDEARSEAFRKNFLKELRRTGLTLKELSEKSGVSMQTLRYWKRVGIRFGRNVNLDAVAQVLGIEDPACLFEESPPDPGSQRVRTPPDDVREIDRRTNPHIEEVSRDQPQLFQDFDDDDWRELYSLHGTGGPLTVEGVFRHAELINRKRDLRAKFDLLLESDHLDALGHLIDVLYRDAAR